MRTECDPAVTQKVTQQKRDSGAHLYIIRSEAGLVKIGRSNSPRKRKNDLQCASGHRLILVKVLRGRGGEERAVHDAASQWRKSGEWFHDTFDFRVCVKAFLEVDFRFSGEPEEEEDVVQTRRQIQHDRAIQDLTESIKREGEKRAKRRAEIVAEKEIKRLHRAEREAIARDYAALAE